MGLDAEAGSIQVGALSMKFPERGLLRADLDAHAARSLRKVVVKELGLACISKCWHARMLIDGDKANTFKLSCIVRLDLHMQEMSTST